VEGRSSGVAIYKGRRPDGSWHHPATDLQPNRRYEDFTWIRNELDFPLFLVLIRHGVSYERGTQLEAGCARVGFHVQHEAIAEQRRGLTRWHRRGPEQRAQA
jgi:hypothetical protein